MKKSRFTVSQTLGFIKQNEFRAPVSERCIQHGFSSVIFYKWRDKYGGMDASMLGRCYV